MIFCGLCGGFTAPVKKLKKNERKIKGTVREKLNQKQRFWNIFSDIKECGRNFSISLLQSSGQSFNISSSMESSP